MNNKCTQKCQDCRCINNRNANMNVTDKTGNNRKTATDNQWTSQSNQNQMNNERSNRMTDQRSNEQFNSKNNNRQFR